jgi:hypothetical protein
VVSNKDFRLTCGREQLGIVSLGHMSQHLNGEEYLNFLQNVLSDLLDHVPLLVRRNTNLENRWIDRDGPDFWPARSPDLNPCDLFLWAPINLIWAKKIYKTII